MNQVLTKPSERMPVVFDDFFRPWSELFDNGSFLGRTLTVPAVNVIEGKNNYTVTLAVPGMKKDDFKIDVNGTLLTISCDKEENKEEKEKKFTRREYRYSSFSRSFTLTEEINKDKIEASYEDGVLKIWLPFKEEAQKHKAKYIPVK